MAGIDLDDLLPAIAAGDSEAFGRWLSGAERPLRESLRPFAASVDVEAILQEALLRTWQVAPRVRPDGRPNALLRMALRIARNHAVSELRRSRPDAVDPEMLERLTAADEMAEPKLPDPLLRRLIAECRERLPRQPARALLLRLDAAGGEPDETLAARAGMTLNTFLQNFTRARRALAECLKGRGVELEGGAR